MADPAEELKINPTTTADNKCYIHFFEDLRRRESSDKVEAWLFGGASQKVRPSSLARYSAALSSKD